jgi:hypothetical protein
VLHQVGVSFDVVSFQNKIMPVFCFSFSNWDEIRATEWIGKGAEKLGKENRETRVNV